VLFFFYRDSSFGGCHITFAHNCLVESIDTLKCSTAILKVLKHGKRNF
jgi:hypothetical protein